MNPSVLASVLISAALAAQPSISKELRARVLDRPAGAPSGDPGKLLFNFRQTEEKLTDGKLRLLALHLNPDGSEAMREEAIVDSDGVPIVYNYEQKQLGEHGKVEVKDGKVLFRYVDAKGASTSDEEWTPNYVVGPTILRYIDKHWDELVAGKELPLRIGVPERHGSYGFKLVPETSKPGADKVRIQLKAASFLVSLAMEPVELEFDAKTRRPLRAYGHAFPKKRKGDGWGDLVAETVYEK